MGNAFWDVVSSDNTELTMKRANEIGKSLGLFDEPPRVMTHARLLRDVPTLGGDLKQGEVFRIVSVSIVAAGNTTRGLCLGDPSCMEMLTEDEAKAAGFNVELGKKTKPLPRLGQVDPPPASPKEVAAATPPPVGKPALAPEIPAVLSVASDNPLFGLVIDL